MKQLIKLARSATPSTGVQFRGTAYGAAGTRDLLRDVLAMANAAVDGARYIVTGAVFNKGRNKQVRKIDSDDFTGKPSYQSLANEFIEPPVRIKYQPVVVSYKQCSRKSSASRFHQHRSRSDCSTRCLPRT